MWGRSGAGVGAGADVDFYHEEQKPIGLVLLTQMSDACWDHMSGTHRRDTSPGHISGTHVRDTCWDSSTRHMCGTHVGDTCRDTCFDRRDTCPGHASRTYVGTYVGTGHVSGHMTNVRDTSRHKCPGRIDLRSCGGHMFGQHVRDTYGGHVGKSIFFHSLGSGRCGALAT